MSNPDSAKYCTFQLAFLPVLRFLRAPNPMKLLQRFLSSALVLLMLFPPQFVYGWGSEGHIAINTVASKHIPRDMPSFFRHATDRLAYLGPEPDRWRSPTELALKQSQEPDHFLNLEMLDGFGEMPPGRYDFIAKLAEKRRADEAAGIKPADGETLTPEHVGMQPYITMEVYGRLKAAFREYRHLQADHKDTRPVEQAIVFYAGWLGHYVADASQPLHVTIHYNGWVGPNPNQYTTDKHTHSNFETTFVQHNLKQLEFSGLVNAPQKLDHPFEDYMQYLRTSNGLVEKLYQLEKTGAFKDNGTPEGLEFVRQRLAAGSQMLLNLWYTAWLESAVEPPPRPAPRPEQQPKPALPPPG
jgi:hypothetical protein